MKELLKRLLDDISINLSYELRSEMKTVVERPEILSPRRSYMQNRAEDEYLTRPFSTNPTSTVADMTSNHDFLAQIPLSPKQDSDCNVSDLSSSFWSARCSVKNDLLVTHEYHKLKIPLLDLENLPPDSDDENAVGQKSIQNEQI